MKKLAKLAVFAAVAFVVTGCNGWGCGSCCPKPCCPPRERCCTTRPVCCDVQPECCDYSNGGMNGGEYYDNGHHYDNGNGRPVPPPPGK